MDRALYIFLKNEGNYNHNFFRISFVMNQGILHFTKRRFKT